MYLFSYAHKKRFAQNGAGSIPIWIPIFCLVGKLPAIKWQFCIRCFKEIFNVLLLKATLSLDVFLQYATLFLEIQMCVLFPPSKTKSITLHNLLMTMAESIFCTQNTQSAQNLLQLERNLDL